MKRVGIAFAALCASLASACLEPAQAEAVVSAPEAAVKAREARGLKTAVLAGGCFWGMEAVFSHVKGVSSVVSGFEGGKRADARYDTVSTGTTGHAEAVRITYDPSVVRYDQLLQVFFSVASDPTQLNRQYPDTGTQYRNAVVPQSPEQARVARAYIAQLSQAHAFARPITTRIEQGRFFPAEADHQNFYDRNPGHPYIMRWDKPKVAGFRAGFPGLARAG